MEKLSGFGYHRHLMPPNVNLSGFLFDAGHLHKEPVYRNPHSVENPTLRNVPSFPISGLQESRASDLSWFFRAPHFDQAFAPMFDLASKEKSPAGLIDLGQQRSPAEKRFLVFDQSGDKTTFIYTSGVPTPVQFGTSWAPKPPIAYNLSKDGPMDCYNPLRPSMNDEIIEDNSRDVMEDEMHEDTEELNALLCSDDDSDFSEDDEETSTGHSPSTMTDNGIPDLIEETGEEGEEVDSFAAGTKRRKLLDGDYDVPSDGRAPSSGLEDDAESSCGDDDNLHKEQLGSFSGCKRSRKDKIHETVGILQSIVPGANGKDAIMVLDEAIHYLRSLKVKAKALGLDSL